MWKRIPDNIKSEHPELKKIWDVGVALWNRNLPNVYSALEQNWSEGVANIMTAVKGKSNFHDFERFFKELFFFQKKLAKDSSNWSVKPTVLSV